LGCTNNHRSIHSVYLVTPFFGWGASSHYRYAGPGYCGSRVFIAEEADGVGDKGSGNNISIETDTHGGLSGGLEH